MRILSFAGFQRNSGSWFQVQFLPYLPTAFTPKTKTPPGKISNVFIVGNGWLTKIKNVLFHLFAV